eukprot:scaffold694_cov338-Pavlova_lutheri.AAC.44
MDPPPGPGLGSHWDPLGRGFQVAMATSIPKHLDARGSTFLRGGISRDKKGNGRTSSKTNGARCRKKNPITRACGIVGVYTRGGAAAPELYEALLMLQHRGQDSAGMVTQGDGRFHEAKANGLVKDVFVRDTMEQMQGNVGIAHVRYPTAGTSSAAEAQPFFVNSPLGIFLIHNGNLTNTDELRQGLQGPDSFFNRHLRTTSDSEVLLNVLADEIHRANAICRISDSCQVLGNELNLVFDGIQATMNKAKGAYSAICMVQGVGLVAFRDRHGIRPLVLGKRESKDGMEYAVASEDCAFGPLGYSRVRDIQPGEAIIITPQGELQSRQLVEGKLSPCLFEYIYLSRPDTVINDISVYAMQLNLGRRLARRIKEKIDAKEWEVDIVVPVPDGSRPAAIEVHSQLGLPYREGLVKNRYVGRTFIMPNQKMRELSVRRKLNAMSGVFMGKNVLLIDDSIVRGTTMQQIVDMCRAAGANKVYLASAAPAVRFPNVYGVDMPSRKELIAGNLSEEEVCDALGADGLLYQTVEDLIAAGQDENPSIQEFDASCFNGCYVTGDVTPEYLQELEGGDRGSSRSGFGKRIQNLVAAASADED